VQRGQGAGSRVPQIHDLVHDPEKVGTGFPNKSCSKQADQIMVRFNLIGS